MGRTLLLRLAYEGGRFSGWQSQPGRRTVQGVLAEAITAVSGEPILPKGASRTDAGVHAVDQLVGFTSTKDHAPQVWLKALNANLPEDVVVLSAAEAPEDFDPVSAAVTKRYRYRIHDAASRPVLARPFVWRWKTPLDTAAMQAAAEHLIGEHDFSSFENPSSPRQSKIRRIDAIDIGRRQGGMKSPGRRSGSRSKGMVSSTIWFASLLARWSWLAVASGHPNGPARLLRPVTAPLPDQPRPRRD